MVPLAVGMMPASTAAARLSADSAEGTSGAAGLAITAVGFVWLAQLSVGSSYWPVLLGMIVTGVGLGLGMTPATNAIVESLPIAKQGLASAVNDTSREMGGAFGIAIVGSAFTAGYRSHIPRPASPATDPGGGQRPPGTGGACRSPVGSEPTARPWCTTPGPRS